ncbi:MAG: hypothetical protein EYC70_00720 [Planctomycetota bacterium]|nr:MAG: hypothetical protein EYC70_00720 [Planctomycetota bacterium]
MTLTSWLDLVRTVAIASSAVFAAYQYYRGQVWKKSEFTSGVMKDFFQQPRVRSALTMLDWAELPVELFPDQPERAQRSVVVTEAMIREALRTHQERTDFNETETAIRRSFDSLLFRLATYDHYVASGLIRDRDLQPYLGFWMRVALGREGAKGAAIQDALWRYADFYRFSGAARLAARLGRA